MLNGNLNEARDRWADVRRLPPKSLAYQVGSAITEAELDLWTSRPADAYQRCATLLHRDDVLATQEGWSAPLLITALRACADMAESARARRNVDLLRASDQSRTWLTDVRRRADPGTATYFVKLTGETHEVVWQAESSRAEGESSADLWRQVAAAWEGQHRIHRAAYAHWRQAEALLSAPHTRAAAADALRTASKQAAQQAPLLHAIEDLARRARLDLNPPARQTDEDKPSVHPFGLTDRELLVLHLVAAGRSNGEIGAKLFISRKTASVHVSNILRKLNASTRVEAATLAERAGLHRDAR
jgi:DNA-binding NarL/FixJ family response regulator